jgi:hypothetical protein
MFEDFKEELRNMFDELEQEVEKHELAETIRERQPWVLWESGEEQEAVERIPIIDDFIDFFRSLFKK